jgi:two-component system, LuxR family, response regulator FixJ
MAFATGPVLIVDDDAAVRTSLKFVLELEGLDVRTYDSGRSLLADGTLPAKGCLVIDQSMPKMRGLDLVRRLKDRAVQLPTILITANVTDDLKRKAVSAGVQAVLEKPLDDSSLIDSIRAALHG